MGVDSQNADCRELASTSTTDINNQVWNRTVANEPVAAVFIESLLPAESPRRGGINRSHVHLLAEADGVLPPILVHRQSMRVIDGMHRVEAAACSGHRTIDAKFFDGPEDAAFVLAVEANVTHGLPLTMADREAAVRRILTTHPRWSDRAISRVAGVSPKTVGSIRRRASEDSPQSNTRIGQDGRVRPLSSVDGRRAASVFINGHPEASLRDVAKAAGISVATARDVRERMKRGDDPVPERLLVAVERKMESHASERNAVSRTIPPVERSSRSILRLLQEDPSLRFSEAGRLLLQWLAMRAVDPAEFEDLGDAVPPHSAIIIADLAHHCAAAWHEIAELLEQKFTVTA